MDFYPNNFFNDKVVVGVNRVCKFFRCDYTVSKDQKGINEIKSGQYGKLICSLWDRGSRSGRKVDISLCDYVFTHPNNIMLGNNFYTRENDLLVSLSTVSTAIHLAAYMGAKNIYVCGHDGKDIDGEYWLTGYYTMGRNMMAVKTISDYSGFVSVSRQHSSKICKFFSEQYGCNIFEISLFN